MEEFVLEQNISSSIVENFIKQNPIISDLGETNLDWENKLLLKEENSKKFSHLAFSEFQQKNDFNELPSFLCLNNENKSPNISDNSPKSQFIFEDKIIHKHGSNMLSPHNDTHSFTFLDPFSSSPSKTALKGLCMNTTNTSWTSSLASPPPTKPPEACSIKSSPKVHQSSSVSFHDTLSTNSNTHSSSSPTLNSAKSINTILNLSLQNEKHSFNNPEIKSADYSSLQDSLIHKNPLSSVSNLSKKTSPILTSLSQKTDKIVQKQNFNFQLMNIENEETASHISISNSKQQSLKLNHSPIKCLTVNSEHISKFPNSSQKSQESPGKIHCNNSMNSEDLSIFFSSPASTKSKHEKKVPKRKALKRKKADDDFFNIDFKDNIKHIKNSSQNIPQPDTTKLDNNYSLTDIFHTSYTLNKTSPNENVESDPVTQKNNKSGVDEKNDTSVTDSMLYNVTTGSEAQSDNDRLQSAASNVQTTPSNSQNKLNPEIHFKKTDDVNTAEKQISNIHTLNCVPELYSPTSPFINQHHFTTSTPIRPFKHHAPLTRLFNQISEHPAKILNTPVNNENKMNENMAKNNENIMHDPDDDSTIKSDRVNHLSLQFQEVRTMTKEDNKITMKNKETCKKIQNFVSSTQAQEHTIENAADTHDVATNHSATPSELNKNSVLSSLAMRSKKSRKFLYPTQAQIISSMPTFVLNDNSQLKQRYNLTFDDENKNKLNENNEVCDNYEEYAKNFESNENNKVDLYRIPLGPIKTWKNEDKAKLFLYSSLKLQPVETPTPNYHPPSTLIHEDTPNINSNNETNFKDVSTPCKYETVVNVGAFCSNVVETEGIAVVNEPTNKTFKSSERKDSIEVSFNNCIYKKKSISHNHTKLKADLQSHTTNNTFKNKNLNIEDNNIKKDLHGKMERVCTGFTTGRGGSVKVGASSIHHAVEVLASEQEVLLQDTSIKPYHNLNKNTCNIDNDNVDNIKNHHNANNNNGININSGNNNAANSNNKQTMTGFKTAGGNRLKVNKDALDGAWGLMDAQAGVSDDLHPTHGLVTKRRKVNDFNASKLKQNLVNGGSYMEGKNQEGTKSTTGFMTASGNGLKVNKDTLKNVEFVLNSDDNDVKPKRNAIKCMPSREDAESMVSDVERCPLTTSQVREVNEVSVLCNTHDFVSTQAFFLEEGCGEEKGRNGGVEGRNNEEDGVKSCGDDEFVDDKVCDSSKHSTSGVFDGFDDDFCDYFDNSKASLECNTLMENICENNNEMKIIEDEKSRNIVQNKMNDGVKTHTVDGIPTNNDSQNDLIKTNQSSDNKNVRHDQLATNKMAEKKKDDEWGESENYWLMDFMQEDGCDDSSKINNLTNSCKNNNEITNNDSNTHNLKNDTIKQLSLSNKNHTIEIKQSDNSAMNISEITAKPSSSSHQPHVDKDECSRGDDIMKSIEDGKTLVKQNNDKKASFFQTARGKNVEVSEESLKMVKEVFCEPLVSDGEGKEFNRKGNDSNGKNTEFNGKTTEFYKKGGTTKSSLFQTANGKSVDISEKSMKIVKKMFNDTDSTNKTNDIKTIDNLNKNNRTVNNNGNSQNISTKDDVVNEETTMSLLKTNKDPSFINSSKINDLNTEENLKISDCNSKIIQTTSKCNEFKIETIFNASQDLENSVNKKVDTHPSRNAKLTFCTPYKSSLTNDNSKTNQHANIDTANFSDTNNDKMAAQTFLTKESVNILRSERELQKMAIEKKMRSVKVKASMGSLSLMREQNKGNRMQLKDLSKGKCPNKDINKMKSHGVSDQVIHVTAADAEDFKFKMCIPLETDDGGTIIPNDEGFITKRELYDALVAMKGVDANLIDQSWVFNHYRWVVWKLASMERSFPEVYGGGLLSPEAVISQLRWRYDVEVLGCRRSVIKRITENDDTSRRGMVLCVAELKGCERVVLTDGWYCLKCVFDEALWSFVKKNKIKIGTKLVIFGAVLVGNTKACTPLQASEEMALKISGNSTRRALWHAKLGCLVSKKVFKIPLSSIVLNGGMVCCVDVVVVRRYPRMYSEWVMENVKGIVRSERLEKKFADAFERKKQKELEEFYEKCQSDFEKKRLEDRKNNMFPNDMETSEAELDERRREMEVFVKDRLHEWKVAHPDRKVRGLLKFQVRGCHWSDVDTAFSSWLTVRDVGGEVDELLGEGRRLLISNLTVHMDRHARIHLNTCRSSKFQSLPVDRHFLNLLYQPRQTSSFQHIYSECLSCDVTNNEFDVVCLVVMVTEMSKSESGLQQIIYVVDEEGVLGRLRLWGGLAAYGVESLIMEGLIIACSNLKVDKYYYRDIKKESSLNQSCNNSFNKSTFPSYQFINNSSSKNISKTSSNDSVCFFDQSSTNCTSFPTTTPSHWILMQVDDLTEFTTRPRSPHLKCSFNAFNAKLKVKKNYLSSIKEVVLNAISCKTSSKWSETCNSSLSNSSIIFNNIEIDNNKENCSHKSSQGVKVETSKMKDGNNLLRCSQNSGVKQTPMKHDSSGRILRSHARASGLKGKRKSENTDFHSKEKIRKSETNTFSPAENSLKCNSILDTAMFTTSVVPEGEDDKLSEICPTQKNIPTTADTVEKNTVIKDEDESYITSSYVDDGKDGLCYESSIRNHSDAMFDDTHLETVVDKVGAEYNEDLLSGIDWMSETQFIH